MSKGTTVHTVRVEDDLWAAARAKAAAEGETVSEVIRGRLAEYVAA